MRKGKDKGGKSGERGLTFIQCQAPERGGSHSQKADMTLPIEDIEDLKDEAVH